jgi:predicted MPP superfamily phosphohydrolase
VTILSDTTWPRKEEGFDEQDLFFAPDSDELPDPLEARLLHKLLVALNAPAGWPGWLIGLVSLFPILALVGLWWLVIGRVEGLYLGMALTLFTLADAVVLVSLPRRRLSFGPVGPQLFTLEFPRLAVALLAALVALWLGPTLALIGVVVINLGASLALVWGTVLEPQRLALSHLSLVSNPLPHDAPPLRLLHISDLHVERFGRREEQLLHMVRQIAPDLILLTGDYLNLSYVDDPAAHAEARRVLAALAPDGKPLAPAGIYAVLGSPPVDRNSASLFDGLSIRLLRDEVVTVDLGQDRRLALLGLDCSHDLERDAERLAAVAAQAPPDTFRVLLYHSPELMPVAPEFDIKLYVCGHTHGGQIRLPLYGAVITSSKLGKRFEMGHYRLGNTHLYVSRGVGLEGMGAPRVRFLCPPEITLFSLNGVGDKSLNTRAKEEAKRESLEAKSTESTAGLLG